MAKDHSEKLLNELMTSKRMTVQEAIDLLQVSKSTVRRIFIDLEKRGTVVRSYGGVQLVSPAGYSFDTQKKKFSKEKARIGKEACTFVKEDDVIFIDAGTTSMNFAFQLSQEIAKGETSVRSIFTNSIAVLDVFAGITSVNLIGGEYRMERKDFYGYLSEMVIARLHFTKCFLGTDGVINQSGFAAKDFSTASMNTALLKNSSQCIVLTDHSKFALDSYVEWASFGEINTVITDANLDKESAEKLRNEGCRLILV